MKNKRLIISMFLGLLSFGLVFILGKNAVISAVCGIIVYGAFFFLLAPKKEEEKPVEISEEDSLKYYRNVYFKELNDIKIKIDHMDIRDTIDEILVKANSIVDFVEAHKGSLIKIKGFMDYYMPATMKILVNYVQVQNSALDNEEKQSFMGKVVPFLAEIKEAFSKQLKELYDNKLTDSTIEMETLKKSLLMEGLLTQDDFKDI